MVEHPEGPDLLGKAGRNGEGVAERLKEVVFALQEVCHVQNKVHELRHTNVKNYITTNHKAQQRKKGGCTV